MLSFVLNRIFLEQMIYVFTFCFKFSFSYDRRGTGRGGGGGGADKGGSLLCYSNISLYLRNIHGALGLPFGRQDFVSNRGFNLSFKQDLLSPNSVSVCLCSTTFYVDLEFSFNFSNIIIIVFLNKAWLTSYIICSRY